MATDNHIDFTVRVKNEGLGELAADLSKVEEGTKGLGAAGEAAGSALGKLDAEAKQAGADVGALAQAQNGAAKQGAELGQAAAQGAKGVQDLGRGASQAGSELAELRQALDAKTAAIKSGLLVEQSEIELQRQHLAAAAAEQQARLRAAQAQGDEAAATRAGNALRQIEGDQLALVARAKRAEATAVQQAADARRQELAAIGPLTAAQQRALQAAENHAKALRVEAAAADLAAQRSRDLTTSHKSNAAATDQLGTRVQGLSQLLGQMAGALGAAFTFRELVTAAAQMESMREGLRAVSGSAEQAGRDMDFVRTVANRVGADVVQVGQAYLGLAAATKGTAVEGEPTRAVFEAVATSMGKAGKSAAETQNALVALAQMASKGTVSMEELRGQLGEALPGALQAAANGLGITTQDLIKLVENGEIAASDLFPALTKGLNDLYGGAPAAQTLSQEIANIKNAFVEMAANLGDAGGLDALKVGAEIAQMALVLLDDTLVRTGKSIGVLVAAVTTMDFSGLKQSFADIEAEGREKLLKAAQHNETLRSALKGTVDASMDAALAQQELGNKTTKAGADAAAAGPTWVKLASDYGKVLEAVREQIVQSEKSAIARDAEGKAAVALAQAFGTEAEQRKAAASAAQASADAQAQLAQLKATEVEVMKAELAALQDLAEKQGALDEQKKKQLEDLQKQIDLRQQDADKAAAQAQASRLVAEQAKAEAEALKDNSARVAELRDIYEKARVKVEELRAAKAAGKATTEQVTQAEMAAGRAALLYRDALQDQLTVIEARKNAQLADIDVQAAGVRLAIEQARSAYEVARARGDESGAIRAQNELRRLEIELLALSAQAKRAEADAAIATAEAKRAELIAAGQYTDAKRLEIEASLKAAEVKRVEAQIADVTAEKLRKLGLEHQRLGSSARGAVGPVDRLTQSLHRQGDAMERLSKYGKPGEGAPNKFQDGRTSSRGEPLGKGVEEVGSGGHQFRNKDGMTSDAQGNVQQQWIWTRAAIIDYLKQAGMDELLAERLAKQFHNNDGSVDYEASAAQIKWGGKFGTLAEALGKMADYYKHNQTGRHEAQQMLEYERTNAGLNKPDGAPSRNAPAAGREREGDRDRDRDREHGGSPGSGVSAGATYVSNITVDGRQRSVRYADRSSQLAGDALIRELAQAKGVSQ